MYLLEKTLKIPYSINFSPTMQSYFLKFRSISTGQSYVYCTAFLRKFWPFFLMLGTSLKRPHARPVVLK